VSTSGAVAIVLGALAAVNVWVHVGRRVAHSLTGPLAAGLLLLVGRAAGLSWDELGLGREALARGVRWGAVSAALIALVYGLGVAVPATRRFFRDTRYRIGPGSAAYLAFVAIPLGTVIFEEVAFRSVLFGLLEVGHGAGAAAIATSLLFGLWHVLPALDLARTNTALRGPGGARSRVMLTVLGTVAFTTLAGLVFAFLRWHTGSLLGPVLLHWAANGLGVLAAARVWALSHE
jgi:membrane protease YdiL (CAAX protease family)